MYCDCVWQELDARNTLTLIGVPPAELTEATYSLWLSFPNGCECV
jgi:hypothetical protein